MLKRRIGICLLLLMFMVTCFAPASLANSNNKVTAESSTFNDVDEDYWAYAAIQDLVNKKYLSGYNDGTFRPKNRITRAEFAQLMVVALNLKKTSVTKPSFLDVTEDHWAFSSVETARKYLTGFRTSAGDVFRPSTMAVREDMAVALVKALGKGSDSANLTVLDRFEDQSTISANLRKYVAAAVDLGILKGSKGNDGQLRFNPQTPLTRAEAATLIYNIVKDDSTIKVTYDDDENSAVAVPAQQDRTVPHVSGQVDGSRIVLSWDQINDADFQGYKVVISKNNSSPKYPDDGYLYYITDKTQTTAVVDNSTAYNSGDFGSNLSPETAYYFSVTALYTDRKVAGNTILLTYPRTAVTTEYAAPEVTGSVSDGKIILHWTPISDPHLQGYKVVVSKYNTSPKYPDDGYLYWITDKSQSYAMIDNSAAYNGGDFGEYLTPGEEYFFSITAVYDDRKIAGNTIMLTYPGESTPAEYTAPQVSGEVSGPRIIINWTPLSDSRLQGYKVVISKNNSSPKYPDDGYLYWITDKSRSSAVIDNSSSYNGSDFGEYLTPGESYYFSVTAVYDDRKIAGNTIMLTYPGESVPAEYSAPQVSGELSGGNITISWTPISDSRLQGYKLVISKNNSSPKYPNDGYLYWITDKSRSSAVVDNSSAYSGGDFGEYLTSEETYFFSVTAVYNDRKIAGNTVSLTYP